MLYRFKASFILWTAFSFFSPCLLAVSSCDGIVVCRSYYDLFAPRRPPTFRPKNNQATLFCRPSPLYFFLGKSSSEMTFGLTSSYIATISPSYFYLKEINIWLCKLLFFIILIRRNTFEFTWNQPWTATLKYKSILRSSTPQTKRKLCKLLQMSLRNQIFNQVCFFLSYSSFEIAVIKRAFFFFFF